MANKVENSTRISTEKVPLETDEGIMESEERKWGIPLKEMYKQGLAFYKGKFVIFCIYKLRYTSEDRTMFAHYF